MEVERSSETLISSHHATERSDPENHGFSLSCSFCATANLKRWQPETVRVLLPSKQTSGSRLLISILHNGHLLSQAFQKHETLKGLGAYNIKSSVSLTPLMDFELICMQGKNSTVCNCALHAHIFASRLMVYNSITISGTTQSVELLCAAWTMFDSSGGNMFLSNHVPASYPCLFHGSNAAGAWS